MLHRSNETLQTTLPCRRQNSFLKTWILSGRFFCRRLARFKINFRRGAMRIRMTNMCPDILDVPEADSRVLFQCQIRFFFAKLWDCVLETFSLSDARRSLTRPSGKRHTTFEATFLRVQSQPDCIFEDNQAVIRMIIECRTPNLRQVSRTHRVDLHWLSEGINVDSSTCIRYVRATKTSGMRLFDN